MPKRAAAALLAAAAIAAFSPRAAAQQYDPFGNQVVANARYHRAFSLTGNASSTPLPINGASYCVVTVTTAPSSGTLTVYGASDSVPTFSSSPLTAFGTSGVITNPAANSAWPGTTVSPNGGPVALSYVKITSSVSGTAVGSIDCAPINGAGGFTIPTPLPVSGSGTFAVSGSCLPGTGSTNPVGNCWTNATHVKPPSTIGAEPPNSQGAESNIVLGSGSTTSCTYYTGAGSGLIRRVVSISNVTGAAVNATVSVYDTGPVGTTCNGATLRWTFNAAVYLLQPLNLYLANGMALVISTSLPDTTDVLVGVNTY